MAERGWLERPAELARFSLRGAAGVRAAAAAVLGVELPVEACRARTAGARAALWLGPDEHLLLAPRAEGGQLLADLHSALDGMACSLVDVSQRQCALIVSGPSACWMIESACPLDTHLPVFPVGMCTRTVFGKAQIVLWRTAPEAFHIEVWRSFADHVLELLDLAALDAPGS